MPAKLLDGKALAAKLKAKLAKDVGKLKEDGIDFCLAVIRVGEDPASKIYVKNKIKACQEVGIHSKEILKPDTVSQKELLELIKNLNEDKTVDGILVQLPLPKHIESNKVIGRISPQKDVDGFHKENLGGLCSGGGAFVSCTPKGIMLLIEATGVDLTGKHAVVVGRSNHVGKPTALLLLEKNATVTICHSKTKNMGDLTKQADILVVAVGKPNLITKDMVKPGAIVIDVGINRTDQGLAGDVAKDVQDVAGYLTPVPGGVGPMTVACLMENTIQAAKNKWGIKK